MTLLESNSLHSSSDIFFVHLEYYFTYLNADDFRTIINKINTLYFQTEIPTTIL